MTTGAADPRAEAGHPDESQAIVRSRIDLSRLPPLSRAVTEHVIVASADFDYATDLVCDEETLATAVAEVAPPGYTVLGWRASDIAATVRGLTARGVAFLRYDGMDQDEDGVWTTPAGDKIAWFADPDGNVLSLTQFVF